MEPGITFNYVALKPENYKNVKCERIPNDIKDEILTHYKSGFKMCDITRLTGVSYYHIKRIISES